jgi:hypothetical protein
LILGRVQNPGLQLSKYLKFYNLLIAIADADFAKDSPSVPPWLWSYTTGFLAATFFDHAALSSDHCGITKDEMIQVP